MSRQAFPRYEPRHHGKHQDFIKAIVSFKSPGASSAVSSINSALWLLAVGEIAQALFLFHNTIEIALKGLLEEVHVLLTLDRLDYDLAKGIVLERLQKHRLGSNVSKYTDPETYSPKNIC